MRLPLLLLSRPTEPLDREHITREYNGKKAWLSEFINKHRNDELRSVAEALETLLAETDNVIASSDLEAFQQLATILETIQAMLESGPLCVLVDRYNNGSIEINRGLLSLWDKYSSLMAKAPGSPPSNSETKIGMALLVLALTLITTAIILSVAFAGPIGPVLVSSLTHSVVSVLGLSLGLPGALSAISGAMILSRGIGKAEKQRTGVSLAMLNFDCKFSNFYKLEKEGRIGALSAPLVTNRATASMAAAATS